MNLACYLLFFPFKVLLDLLEFLFRCFVPRKRRNLAGKVVLVTGAANGIGRVVSRRFAALGSIVVMWDIDSKGLKDAKEEIVRGGGQAHSYTCDLSKREKIYETAKRVHEEVGNVDVLVNNAGVVSGRFLLDCPDENIEKTIQINLMAHFWMCKAFLPGMVERNSGHIVEVSSTVGFSGAAQLVDYCTSKFGVVGFTDSLEVELRHLGCTGIGLSLVCPWVLGDSRLFKGVTYKLQAFIPPVTADMVADRLVTAVQRNEYLVVVPRVFRLFLLFMTILPRSSSAYLLKLGGSETAMDTFKGHTL
eukprot:m.33778 g.33778  ORF g.33778 m.33778 type:complete len:304 (+) comp31883_c0_seq3:15-926(+)